MKPPRSPPAYDASELYGIIPTGPRVQFDMREIIARMIDGSRFHEYQPRFGTSLLCGFARLHGYQIGILANNGVLLSESALKGAHFIQRMRQEPDAPALPAEYDGFMVGREYERRGITKDGAKLIMAVSGASVPKFTVVCNSSHGAGTYAMAGRAFDPRFVFTWPQPQISAMGAEQAAGVLNHVKTRQLARDGGRLAEQELAAIRGPLLDEYRELSSAYYATSEIWDDGILDPVDTRSVLAIALSASLNAPIEAPHYGVFGM
ncbi:carboxyl transferase domain-containing protein [Bradyrhizobium sp. 160]|uniref:carboxyl transferase domain-containing protein n=1 Tax=Bradyrhizobium sp. 160 TaxID=2782634 RepID=UPI00320AF979